MIASVPTFALALVIGCGGAAPGSGGAAEPATGGEETAALVFAAVWHENPTIARFQVAFGDRAYALYASDPAEIFFTGDTVQAAYLGGTRVFDSAGVVWWRPGAPEGTPLSALEPDQLPGGLPSGFAWADGTLSLRGGGALKVPASDTLHGFWFEPAVASPSEGMASAEPKGLSFAADPDAKGRLAAAPPAGAAPAGGVLPDDPSITLEAWLGGLTSEAAGEPKLEAALWLDLDRDGQGEVLFCGSQRGGSDCWIADQRRGGWAVTRPVGWLPLPTLGAITGFTTSEGAYVLVTSSETREGRGQVVHQGDVLWYDGAGYRAIRVHEETVAIAYEPVANHCDAGERVALSCPVGGGKVVSLCEQGERLTYRFGKPGVVELAYPADQRRAGEAFQPAHDPEIGSPTWTVAFENDGVTYTIQENVHHLEGQYVDLKVSRGGETLANLPCGRPIEGSLRGIDGLGFEE